MISLTQSHEHIINWKAQGKSDDWIAGKLGYSPSEFLEACAFIHRFNEQETAKAKTDFSLRETARIQNRARDEVKRSEPGRSKARRYLKRGGK